MNYNTNDAGSNLIGNHRMAGGFSFDDLKKEPRWMPVQGSHDPKPKSPVRGYKSNEPENWLPLHKLCLG